VTREYPKGIPVAILAGGLARRLGDVTKTIPKALLDIADKPFIANQLELLYAYPFSSCSKWTTFFTWS
jgi:NDP-sugar pyrophosphorylase family protein